MVPVTTKQKFQGKRMFCPKESWLRPFQCTLSIAFDIPSLRSEVPGKVPPNAGAKQQVLRIQQDLRRDSTSEHGILVGIPPSLPMLRHSFFTLKP